MLYKINAVNHKSFTITKVHKTKFCLFTLTSEFSVNLCISLQTKGLPRQLGVLIALFVAQHIDFRHNTAIARPFLNKSLLKLSLLEIKVCTCTRKMHKKLRNRLQQLQKFEQKGCTVLDMRGLALNASFIFLNKRIPSSSSY